MALVPAGVGVAIVPERWRGLMPTWPYVTSKRPPSDAL